MFRGEKEMVSVNVYLSTSEEVHLSDLVLETSPVPHSRDPSNVGDEEKHVDAVLGEFKWLF